MLTKDTHNFICNVEYLKVLEHGSTCFSSLGPAIDCIIHLLKQSFEDPHTLLITAIQSEKCLLQMLPLK